MVDIAKLLASAKPPQTTVPLCLDGELVAAYAEAKQALARAKANRGDSLNGGAGIPEAQARVDELAAAMEPATVGFKVRSVGRKRWTELVAKYPPRKDSTEDVMLGFNKDGLADALIREGLVEPDLSPEQLDLLLDETLSDGQYGELAQGAFFVNRQVVDVPFSSAGSKTASTTEAG